jgi:CubicO group peptidase (beta-lactamase class C family)
MTGDVDGSVESGFEGVRDAFARNFSEHGDVGAGFSLYVEGTKVVDIWGGTDPRNGRAYTRDTLQLVFSTTKGATALCANLLAQRGQLDVDAPVATYWPEFAQAGKERIPVRWLLCHKAGLPTIDRHLSFEDALAWHPVIRALEAQAPLWEPGSQHGYHALTFGFLVGEVVRRVTGKSLGTYFAEEVAEPLGLEFWIGLPPEQEERVAPVLGRLVPPASSDPGAQKLLDDLMGPESLLGRALSLNGAIPKTSLFNRAELHAAELPAANGITNARSVARMYAGIVEALPGGPVEPLLGPAQIRAARTRQTEGPDRCLVFETAFGLGFFTASRYSPYGSPGSLGHTGAGGSVGFCDPEHRIGFGYVMNKMQRNLSGDPRTRGLVRAVYAAIGVEPTFV